MNKVKKEPSVLLLKGGFSSEREISLLSAKSVQKALKSLGYSVVSFDLKNILETENIMCVFNALHGGWGENGTIPAFLNMLKIPYTHSGVFASSVAMNKRAAKTMASSLNIDVAKSVEYSKEWILNQTKAPFDLVIKPNQEGSSVGVFILKKGDLIPDIIKKGAKEGRDFLVEEYINGREFSVAVTDEEVLGIIEIVPKSGFYDYEHKYQKGMTDHIFPKKLPLAIQEKLMENAFQMHTFLGCKGVSRCDFRYDEKSKRIVFLEINTHPGMTDLSLVPEMAAKKGIAYNQLVAYLIERAGFEK